MNDKVNIEINIDTANELRKYGNETGFHQWNGVINKLFELKKYKEFHDHIAEHHEVKTAPKNPGEVMCKICNKTFSEITE